MAVQGLTPARMSKHGYHTLTVQGFQTVPDGPWVLDRDTGELVPGEGFRPGVRNNGAGSIQAHPRIPSPVGSTAWVGHYLT